MSLLIKDVQIVDGKAGEPYKADVLVQGKVISAIGNLKGRKTDSVIDGLGHYLTPGFIDVHTNADHYLSLFGDPSGESVLRQGATTIIGGHCGASLAPLLYGTLESIRKWTDPHDINVDWHGVSDFLKSLERISLGVNFGTFAGHSTVRRAIVGDRTRILQKEMDVVMEVLKEAMRDGAFGLSSGLAYVHGKSASNKEIKDLAKLVNDFNGVYAVHLRNETDRLVESVDEVIGISKSSGAKTVISHLMPIKKYEDKFKEAIRNIEEKSTDVYFDVYPYDMSVNPIYTLLPDWAQVENFEAMLERVRNKETAMLIEKDLKGARIRDLEVAGAPHHEYLVGKTLGEIADNLKINTVLALLHVMDVTNLRATVSSKNINNRLLVQMLTHKRAFIGSHGGEMPSGEFIEHERSTNTFPKYLEIVVGEESLSLPEAIRRITSKPAEFYGIRNRGVIKERMVADLVVLGKTDYEVKHVVIGGRIFGDGKTKGEILRHKP